MNRFNDDSQKNRPDLTKIKCPSTKTFTRLHACIVAAPVQALTDNFQILNLEYWLGGSCFVPPITLKQSSILRTSKNRIIWRGQKIGKRWAECFFDYIFHQSTFKETVNIELDTFWVKIFYSIFFLNSPERNRNSIFKNIQVCQKNNQISAVLFYIYSIATPLHARCPLLKVMQQTVLYFIASMLSILVSFTTDSLL